MKKSMKKLTNAAMILAMAFAVSGCANVPNWCENMGWCEGMFKRGQ